MIFFVVVIVFFMLLCAFGFHILLLNEDVFEHAWDSMLKTLVMSVGEYEFEELFFQDVPPQGFGDNWDLGHLSVPFKQVTYTMFVIFFLMLSLVAINVLVGLTVDDIRNFLENADLRKLTMRLKYILAMERHKYQKRKRNNDKKPKPLDPVITKQAHLEMSITNDLISKEKIWKKIERKQEDQRRKAEACSKKDMKEIINDQTKSLLKNIKSTRKQSEKEKETDNRNSKGKFNESVRSSFEDYEDNSKILACENAELQEKIVELEAKIRQLRKN